MKKLLAIIGGLGACLLAMETLAAGALAIDGRQGDQWGASNNYQTQADADARALRECGQGCSIVARFSNSCAAFAADQTLGSTAFGRGHAATASQAQTIALEYCRQYGGTRSNCVVRAWGCDAAEPEPEPEPEADDPPQPAADDPSQPAAPANASNQRGGMEQVGEATALLPEWACKRARDGTEGYALSTEYVVTHDSGCSCSREVKPDWDESAPGWACKVRVLYDRRDAVKDRELRVATSTGRSRENACQSVGYRSRTMKVALMDTSRSNWEAGRRDSGCYCPVEGYEPTLGGAREWYCERIVRYYR